MSLYSVSMPPAPSTEVRPPRSRVLIAEDNLVLRLGLRSVLEASPDILVIGETSTDIDDFRRVERLSPDVVLLGAHGAWWDADSPLTFTTGRAAILMVADDDDHRSIRQAFQHGVTSYVVHGQFTTDDLVAAVLTTARRQPYLSGGALSAMVESFRTPVRDEPTPASTPHGAAALSVREAELMELIVVGDTNREIAQTLFISEKTVKNHVNHIYTKLGARNRAEVIAMWLGLRKTHQPVAA